MLAMGDSSGGSDAQRFDDYGFTLASAITAEVGGGAEDERCHHYSPLKPSPTLRQQWKTLLNDHRGSTNLGRDPSLKKKLRHMLKDGSHHSMRGEIWRWFLGTSQTRAGNKFDYSERISSLHCKLEKYGLSDSSREQNIRRISLLLDTRSAAEVCVGSQCVGGEGEMKNCAVVDEKAGRMSCNKVEEEEGERGGISDRREENSTMGNDGEKGRVVVEEEDRELLFVSRQIMLDIIRTFPTHQLFSGETETKLCLYRVLMMYSQYNSTVGYCQGMAYIAALLLMHMSEEEDVFWALVILFESDKYLSGFYDVNLSRIQSCASIFSMMLVDRQSHLAKHLTSLSIHPLMYMTSWFMCLFTTLPSWDTVLTICDLVFLEGFEVLFRAGLAIMDVCSAELMAMDTMDTVLTFIQKPPSRLMSYRVLIPVLWRTSIVRSEVEWYQDRLVGNSPSRPLKRSAPSAENRTPAKRRKLAGDAVASTPNVQSFLSRLVTVLTPASWQAPYPQDTAASNNMATLLHTPQLASEQTSAVKRCPQTEGRKRARRGVVRTRRDLTGGAQNSLSRSNRKRKRNSPGNFGGQISNGGMIEMKQFSVRTQTVSSQKNPHIPVFLSPSLPPPFCLSPSPAHSQPILQETPSLALTISPTGQVTLTSPSFNTPSPLRRSRRLAKLRGQSSLTGHPSPVTVSFISPSGCPVKSMLSSGGCSTEERKAFQSFATPTALRRSQVRASCSDTPK